MPRQTCAARRRLLNFRFSSADGAKSLRRSHRRPRAVIAPVAVAAPAPVAAAGGAAQGGTGEQGSGADERSGLIASAPAVAAADDYLSTFSLAALATKPAAGRRGSDRVTARGGGG